MTTKRVNIVLLAVGLTVCLQLYLIYQQNAPQRQAEPIVEDAPAGTVIDLENLNVKGQKGASVVLVEFSDYECPFCRRHATTVGKELEERFVATGRIRYAFANNPLPIHPSARLLGSAALCAAEQDEHWLMREYLFSSPVAETQSQVMELAQQVVPDVEAFEGCLRGAQVSGSAISDVLELERAKALDLGLSGTPAFAVGTFTDGRHVSVQTLIRGAQPLELFADVISALE